MANVKLIVLRSFSAYDATGVVSGFEGDKIETGEGTAKYLIKGGYAKKARPHKVKEKGE